MTGSKKEKCVQRIFCTFEPSSVLKLKKKFLRCRKYDINYVKTFFIFKAGNPTVVFAKVCGTALSGSIVASLFLANITVVISYMRARSRYQGNHMDVYILHFYTYTLFPPSPMSLRNCRSDFDHNSLYGFFRQHFVPAYIFFFLFLYWLRIVMSWKVRCDFIVYTQSPPNHIRFSEKNKVTYL